MDDKEEAKREITARIKSRAREEQSELMRAALDQIVRFDCGPPSIVASDCLSKVRDLEESIAPKIAKAQAIYEESQAAGLKARGAAEYRHTAPCTENTAPRDEV